MAEETVAVGLMGLGTVGGGVVRLLAANQEKIRQKLGVAVEISKILVRDPSKPRQVEVARGLLAVDPADILEDDRIAVVVELMGGLHPAREYISRALARGKSVVTANKDVLAVYGPELYALAGEHRVDLLFEASVGGGIPVIHPIREGLAGNRLYEVMGVVNGTTNFILTRMSAGGQDFHAALAEAQALGYAEADPRADVGGDDAARKIAILASIAFDTIVTYDDVYVEGITGVTPADIAYGNELGYTLKLLAIARQVEGEVEARVHPAFLPQGHPLAAVNDVFNAIFVRGDAVGQTMFYGPGAGQMPTASAVVGDIVEAVANIRHGSCSRISYPGADRRPIRPMGDVRCKYYLRLTVQDQPGVLARIAGVFGDHGVSLASVIQKKTVDGLAELVLVTHEVKEEDFRRALSVIAGLPVVRRIENAIRVEEEWQ
ncbi:MAG: homoserine dehydrogenase [Clostridia bacterium]|nr:MAG: homoserine dehydrogenase [Clostridia bacterium]